MVKLTTGIRKPRRREKFVRKQIGTVEVRNRPLKRANCVLALQEFWNERSGSGMDDPSKIFRVFKPHEHLPDSIDCIKIKRNETFGNHIVTEQNLSVGQVVMISKPFASVVNQTVHSYCLTCHEVDSAFIPCDRCSAVKFCSIQCKMNNKAHEYECGSNYHVFDYKKEIDIKLAIQIILEALAIFEGEATHLQTFVEDLLRTTANFEKKATLTRLNDGETRLRSLMSLQSVQSEKLTVENVQIAFENMMNLPKVQKIFSDPDGFFYFISPIILLLFLRMLSKFLIKTENGVVISTIRFCTLTTHVPRMSSTSSEEIPWLA